MAASLPFSLGATTEIFGKHIDELEQDRAVLALDVVLHRLATPLLLA
jgi:hypothetical protein